MTITKQSDLILAWKKEERERFLSVCDAIDHAQNCEYDEGKDAIQRLYKSLGIKPKPQHLAANFYQTKKQQWYIIDLHGALLEVRYDPEAEEHNNKMVSQWRECIKEGSSEPMTASGIELLIHLHLVRVYGENADRKTYPENIDAINVDPLTLHLMTNDKEIHDRAQQISIAEGMVKYGHKYGGEHYFGPGYVRQNYNKDGVRINGNNIYLNDGPKFPESVLNSLVGRPLHEVLDINGFRDDDLVIESADIRELAMGQDLYLVIDRTKNWITLHPNQKHNLASAA